MNIFDNAINYVLLISVVIVLIIMAVVFDKPIDLIRG